MGGRTICGDAPRRGSRATQHTPAKRRHCPHAPSGSVALITQHRAGFDYIDIVRVLAEDVCIIVVAAPEEALENPFVTWADVDAKGASSGGRPEPATDVDAMAYILSDCQKVSCCHLNNCFNLAGQMSDGDIFFLGYPLFAITGCHNTILAAALVGGAVVLQEQFDPDEAVALIERHQCIRISRRSRRW